MKHLFVDTNVLLDLLIDRNPFPDITSTFFERASKSKGRLYVASASFNNIYHIIRRHSSRAKALELITYLSELVEILAIDNKIINRAIKSDFNDFEDAIQYYCALSNPEIEAIITRNEKDFKKSTLPIFNTQTALSLL